MATSRYGRPGTYPEKSIGLGNLEHKYSKYFRQNDAEIVLNVCGTNLKWPCLWMCGDLYCTCANLGWTIVKFNFTVNFKILP